MQSLKSWISFSIFIAIFIQIVLTEPKWFTAIDGTRFLIEVDEKFNWYQASKSCKLRDTELIAIESEDKNNLIKDIFIDNSLKNYNLWIGGKNAYGDRGERDDSDNLGSFYWAATDVEFSYSYWSEDQPDNNRNRSDEHCVYILENSFPPFGWSDNSCYTSEYGYICEEKLLDCGCKETDGDNTKSDSTDDTKEEDIKETTETEEKITESTPVTEDVIITEEITTETNNVTWLHFPSFTPSDV